MARCARILGLTRRIADTPVACQNSSKAPDLGFYPRCSCSFVSSTCSWSGCSAGWYCLCVPKTSSTSCDQAVLVDQASGVGLPSDVVPAEIDRYG